MTETLYYLTQFNSETLAISGLLLLLVSSLIITFWFYNRRKFHQLSHQIPASVVKNYIDSIIQNSNSLKSSLFRGGGIDLGNGIPSVLPLNNLPSGTPISISGGSEELHQKNAEIASLHARLAERNSIVKDLERKISELDKKGGGSGEEVAIYKGEIEKLQKKVELLTGDLAKAQEAAGKNTGTGAGDGETKKQLDIVTKERDELKERLKEYEIIEEDLANLKRLQQENEKLKKSLEAFQKGGGAPVVETTPAAAAIPAEVASATVQDGPALPSAEVAAVSPDMNAAIAQADAAGPAKIDEVPAQNAGDQKSAEELLSEFEKMLG